MDDSLKNTLIVFDVKKQSKRLENSETGDTLVLTSMDVQVTSLLASYCVPVYMDYRQ